ncbi:MAG: exodeoxyribonuclease III [Lachnospiraceae bacterium]
MRLVSWNVNGIRACVSKGEFERLYSEVDADVICIQETKMQVGQADIGIDGYESYWNSAVKKGYSGTAVFTRVKPISVNYDIGVEEHTGEGRAITLEFEDFYLVNLYVPNAQNELARIEYRMSWEDALRDYVCKLDQVKPVIVCGDLNVAHQEIDLKNPKANRKNAGFSDEERGKMTELLAAGFVDSFRYLYPDLEQAYSWWSYRFKAREKNAGWRIDYFLVSEKLKERIVEATILATQMGSDHCPVVLDI